MRTLLLFLLFCTSVFADPSDPYVLAATEGDPSANPCPYVNSLTGDFVVCEVDAVVEAVEPIVIQRTHVSGDGHSDWSFFPHTVLRLCEGGSHPKKYIRVREPSGTMVIYRFLDEDHHVYKLSMHKHGKGVANTSQGIISGRANLKNTVLYRGKQKVTMHCANGSVRTYKEMMQRKYLLQEEKLPSGRWILYTYDSRHRLKTVRTMNPAKDHVYAEIKFKYKSKSIPESPFTIHTSEGKELDYKYENGLLINVSSKEKPTEKLEYTFSLTLGNLIKERNFDEEKKIRVDYYLPDNNPVEKPADPRCNRVRTIYETVGNEVIPTYRFAYDISRETIKEGKYAYKENGTTEIFDVDNNLTRVRFSPQFYILAIERFENREGGQKLHSKLSFTWDHEGQLEKKTLFGADGLPVWERSFAYGARGNVLLETLSGDLRGEGKWESYSTRYTYDENNLVRSQTADNGKIVLYDYLPGTDLLTARLVSDGGKIVSRELRFYDKDHLLKTMILDDGSSNDPRHLQDVSERHITCFMYDARGIPEWTEEYYLGTEGRKLLRKTHLVYNRKGKVERKEIYDGSGQISTVWEYDYDPKGHLNFEKNPLGQITTSTYDNYGNQITYTPAKGAHLVKHYDKSGRITRLEEFEQEQLRPQSHFWAQIDLGPGRRTTTFRYNKKSQQIGIRDYLHHETQLTYDLDGHVATKTSPPVLNAYGKEMRCITRFAYNALGKPVSVTTPRGHTTLTRTTCRGAPALIIHPDGTQEQFRYNLDGTLAASIDQEGNETAYTYDLFDRVKTKTTPLSQEVFHYNTFHLFEHTDSEGRTTTYTYDKAGRKTSETTEGETIEYAYDRLGRLSRTKTGDLCFYTVYNLLDQVIEEREEDLNKNISSKVQYAYDDAGNRTTVKQFREEGVAIEISTYDSWNRKEKSTDPLGHTTLYLYNGNKRNALGQYFLEITEINPLGHKTITAYDALGRVESIEKQSAFAEQTAFDEFVYDLDGNLKGQKSTLLAPNGHKEILSTAWDYDSRGRITALIEAEGAFEQKTTTYAYTPKGERKTVTKPDRTTLIYSYDAIGRLKELTSSAQDIHYLYHYTGGRSGPDAVEDLVQSTATHLTYDRRGRPASETLANGLALFCAYDARGRRSTLTLPDRSTVRYTYDAAHLRAVSKYAPDGTLLYTHAYTKYDQTGRLRAQELIGGLGTATYTYDPLGRPTSFQAPDFHQEIETYDPCGNIINMQLHGVAHTYDYDSLFHLTEETQDGAPLHAYLCDSLSRRLEKDTVSQEVNLLNQLFAAFHHDKNGNPLEDRATGTTYVYDSLDRLIEVTRPGQYRLAFAYDPFHRRIAKTAYRFEANEWVPASTLHFLYDGQNEIGSAAPDGTLADLRILGSGHGAEIGAAIAIELDGVTYAPLHDLYGNIALLIDLATLTPSPTLRYTSFGEPLPSPDVRPTLCPWGFSSKRTDPETGLVYFGRRYYLPSAGRFLTPDPAGLTDGLNTYAYLHHSPLTSHDLYGLFSDMPPSITLFTCSFKTDIPFDILFRGFGLAMTFLGALIDNIGYHLIPDLIGGDQIRIFGHRLHSSEPAPEKQQSYFGSVGEITNPNVRQTLVNGIGTFSCDGEEYAGIISSFLDGEKVYYLYNSTEGAIIDLLHSGRSKLGYTDKDARMLAAKWRVLLADMRESGGGIIYHWAFSEGGAITERALSLLTPEERQQIIVNTFGSASLFSKNLAHDVTHYVSVRDGVPMTSPIAYLKAVYCHLTGRPSNVVFIGSFKGIPLIDHGFKNESYSTAMENVADKILQQRTK